MMEAKIEDLKSETQEKGLGHPLKPTGELIRLRLREWWEIIGTFRGVTKDAGELIILFNNSQVVFTPGTNEAKIIEGSLNSGLIGRRIAILKTDIPDKPLLVKIDERGGKATKLTLMEFGDSKKALCHGCMIDADFDTIPGGVT